MYVYFELFSLQLEVHAHLGLQCKYIILESVYVCVCVEHINSLRYATGNIYHYDVLSTEYLLIFCVCMYLSVCMCIHTCMCVCVCVYDSMCTCILIISTPSGMPLVVQSQCTQY